MSDVKVDVELSTDLWTGVQYLAVAGFIVWAGHKIKPLIENEVKTKFPGCDLLSAMSANCLTAAVGGAAGGAFKLYMSHTYEGTKFGIMMGATLSFFGGVVN